MNHQEGFFNESRIFYQAWLPESYSKAVLLIIHRLAEHSGRYMNVVNQFIPLTFSPDPVSKFRTIFHPVPSPLQKYFQN